MASTTSRPKAHLLRELNSTRHSSTSSQHSAGSRSSYSDFDPENEAIMSTRQLDDGARKLPELRASAKKYRRPHLSEPEYAIDTSALAKAFPDFSQGSSSGGSDISIEIGRGAGPQSRNANDRRFEHEDFSSLGDINVNDDSLTFKVPVNKTRRTTEQPLRDSRQSSNAKSFQEALGNRSHGYRSSGLRNEVAGSPAAKAKDYGSSESRKSSESARRTLSAMHAKAQVENDQSHLAEDRPPTIDLTARSTRFNYTKPNHAQESQLPAKFRASTGFQSNNATPKPRVGKLGPPQLTQGSFQLPEMPNVSELVSGVFEDGTPVYSRHGRSRLNQAKSVRGRAEGIKIDEVPVPADEQAIFLSLKILEDRVGLLERQKAELEVNVKQLEEKNDQLETECQQSQRKHDGSDSALGLADSEDQDEVLAGRHHGRATGQTRLMASVKTLKHQLNTAERKVSTTENIIRNVTQERDSAVSQLGVAFVTIEQLKADNETCVAENQDLKNQLGQMNAQHLGQPSTSTERVNAIKKKVADLKEAHQLAKLQSRQRELEPQASVSRKPAATTEKRSAQPDTLDVVEDDGYDELFDLTPRLQQASRDADREEVQRNFGATRSDFAFDGRVTTNARGRTSKNDPTMSAPIGSEVQKADDSQAFTELSYIDTKDIESMREALEAERLKKKPSLGQSKSRYENPHARNPTDQPAQDDTTKQSHRASVSAVAEKRRALSTGPPASEDRKNDTGHERRHSAAAVLAAGSRRRERIEKNMTSAFIIPDITIGHQKLKVSKPTPVSDRLQEIEPYEDEVTVRPSQPPGLALATVINCFEQEIVSLKKQLAKYQEQYNSHDPALSKRRRKYIFEKIESILKTIDAKSDQLYALYDVLEGQKQSGQELTQDEIDVTLQSIGIEASDLDLQETDGNLNEKRIGSRQPWDLTSENSGDDELPWEGIETTVETNRTGSTHGHRRRGSRF